MRNSIQNAGGAVRPVDWLALARETRFQPKELAGGLDVSLRQLERAFAELGLSLREWLDHARLWDACSRLLQQQFPKATHTALGFKGVTGLYHSFKAYHGWTPREYIARHSSSESPGFQRLGKSAPLSELIQKFRRADSRRAQHDIALSALNAFPSRSERLIFYHLRARCRPEALNVAQEH
jgi:AraC-like DNA-binding protein